MNPIIRSHGASRTCGEAFASKNAMMFTDSQIAAYTEDLYRRRHTGIRVRDARPNSIDWQPDPNDCHNNVTVFCRQNPGFTPVRGWLYFDFRGQEVFVKFLAHSVVKTPEGNLVDITPSKRRQAYQYLFIEALLTYDEFVEMGRHTKDGNLMYYWRRNSAEQRRL